jgi:iron complex outermembrane receptor protein
MGLRSRRLSVAIAGAVAKLLRVLLICTQVAPLAAPATPAESVGSSTLAADIPAQPLAQALEAFALQTRLQVVYTSDVVGNLRSHAVSAGLGTDEALARLLQGSGLRFEYLNPHTLRILAVAPPRTSATNSPTTDPLEEVVVAGSRLKHSPAETMAPLLVISQSELSRAGVQTGQELLERISANQSFGSWNETMGLNNGVQGFTAASLRGLGFQRTLVLMNGQRFSPYALSGGQGADLSAIPSAVLERVEVLQDGASAIYGTDAIGGVINFVLRRDYQGAEVNANYFATEHGGASNGRINATAGIGDLAEDQYNAFLSADYFQQQPLRASQRSSTTTGYLPWLGIDRTAPNSFPANITQPAGFGIDARNPTIPYPHGAAPGSCAPPYSFPTSDAPFQCRFDSAHLIETIPETDKASVIARITRQLGWQQQLFAEASYYTGTFIQRISPAPVSSDPTEPSIILPSTSAFYPTAFVASLANGNISLPLDLNYRPVELGPRVDRLTAEQWRALAGLKGQLAGWDYELTGNYTASRQVDRYVSGFLSEPLFGALLHSGVVNPFGFNSPAVVAQMRAAEYTGWVNDNRTANYGGTYLMTRPLFQAPGGPLALAFGAELRRERLEQLSSDALATGQILGANAVVRSLPQVQRSAWALFGEVNVPIARTLEAGLALRTDYFNDFGSATNPKVSVRWAPLPTVTARATYDTGFRVPTLYDLFQPPLYAFTKNNFSDPLRCGVTHSPNDCNTEFVTQSSGNRELTPEKSKQWGAGMVLRPVPGLSSSLDYFRVQVRNVIDTLQAEEIFGNYAYWGPTHVVRKPPDPQYPNLPGEIDYLIENQINRGTISTSGVDADTEFAGPATPIGSLTLRLTGVYTLEYSRAGINTTLFPTAVGTRGPGGAIVRWSHVATLDWSCGRWGATLTQWFQDGYHEVDLLSCNQNFNCSGTRQVRSYSLWNLQARYEIKSVMASLGVRNLFDTPPPVSNQGQTLQVGIDPTYADPRGRMYYLALRYVLP